MSHEKMGGKSPIRVIASSSNDIAVSLLGEPVPEDTRMFRINELINERFSGRYFFKIDVKSEAVSVLRDNTEYDIFVNSLLPDIIEMNGTGRYIDISKKYLGLIEKFKKCNTHIIFFNVSSVVPGELVHNYHKTEKSTSLNIAKGNFELFKLSITEGISVIDIDRLIAEMGADENVKGCGQYSDAAYNAINEEFVRVVEDIGFFEERPLLKQVGRKRGS